MSRDNEERLWTLYIMFDPIHNMHGRGDDRTARDADAPTSRRNPSRGFGRDLGTRPRSATPPERVAFDPRQHLSPSRAHPDRLRRRSRARRAENSRGAVKKGSVSDSSNAFLNPSHASTKPSLNPKKRAIHRARVASSRRVSTASRSIDDEERSFFRSRAFVFAENVPVRQTQTRCFVERLN